MSPADPSVSTRSDTKHPDCHRTQNIITWSKDKTIHDLLSIPTIRKKADVLDVINVEDIVGQCCAALKATGEFKEIWLGQRKEASPQLLILRKFLN